MKKIKGSIAAKIIAWIIFMLNLTIFVGSCIGLYAMDYTGFISSNYERERDKIFADLCDSNSYEYLYYLVESYITEDEFEYLDSLSFKYGIIKARELDVKSIDFNDASIYLRRNFTETVDKENLHIKYVKYAAVDYWIISFVDETVVEAANDGLFDCLGRVITMDAADDFVWADACLQLVFAFKKSAIAIMIISFLFIPTCFIFLISAAGHRKDKDEITPAFLDRIPFDAAIVIWMAMATIPLIIMEELSYYYYYSVIQVVILIICILYSIILGGFFVLSLAVRIKLGNVFKNTITYKLGLKLRYFLKLIFKNIDILWKTVLILLVIAVLEFMGIAYARPREMDVAAMFFIFEKLVLYPVILLAIIQLSRLQKGGQLIAEGDLSHKIDTKRMFWEFKKHGESLNRIGVGMSKAVEDRMKSERFRTELITNVSHDIKTPLTSIINYVDLLDKTDIQNEEAREYIEVLDRQSNRLKKLIEDLIEASKASTGNLSVNMERLDAGVFLTQIAGEYEEKLQQNELNLIISKPEEAVYVKVDGRHLWRVIDNLMNNICKYSQAGSRVYINLAEVNDKITIIFKNMSRYQLNISEDELMERFVRGDSSRNTEGNGLGLSIAGSLMQLMQGNLRLNVDGDLFKVILEFPVEK